MLVGGLRLDPGVTLGPSTVVPGIQERALPLNRAVRAVLSGVCWTLAVVMGVSSAGFLAGGAALCQSGHHRACHPQLWLVAAGIALAIGFGVAGALLYTPKQKGPPRKPWEYER
jgi:hypothetical protein